MHGLAPGPGQRRDETARLGALAASVDPLEDQEHALHASVSNLWKRSRAAPHPREAGATQRRSRKHLTACASEIAWPQAVLSQCGKFTTETKIETPWSEEELLPSAELVAQPADQIIHAAVFPPQLLH